MHSRIEELAAKKLNMQVPDAKRIQVISLEDMVLQGLTLDEKSK